MKQTIAKRCGLILFALMSFSSFAQKTDQEKIVTGSVIDYAGEAILGVNVNVKGTKNGVVTDANGRYAINAKKGDVLSFAYIGMDRLEKTVGNDAVIDVKMKEDASELENVVVVGYGTQKKAHLTGAIETIKMSEIADLPVGDLGVALAGRVLGVGVSGGSSRPGNKSTLKIRNPLTLSKDGGNDSPLYVIDGVLQIDPQGKNDSTLFDNLDSSEVESISFLKDGSAAVYGARSAQGVVLVTTKRGKKGPTKFTYSGSYGVNDETYRTKMMNANDFGRYINTMNGVNGTNATATDPNKFFSPDELEFFKTINYNTLDDEWKPSYNMRHNINASGGTDNATYFAGASYYKQDGNLGTLDYNKWTFRAGVDVNLSSSFKAGLQVSGFYSDKTKTFNKIGGETEENDYLTLLTDLPYIPQYINGNAVEPLGNNDATTRYHYGEIQRLGNLATTNASTMTLNMYAEYTVPFIKGLSIRGAYARNMGHGRGTQVGTGYTLYQYAGTGTNGHIYDDNAILKSSKFYTNGDRLYFDNSSSLSQQYNLNTSYSRNFGKHSISGLFAIERSEAEGSKEVVFKGSPIAATNGQFGSAFGAVDGSTERNQSGSLGYIGRVNYSYGDKYLAEFLYRSDASTKFAPGNYWGNFFNLSAGWVISKEDFFKSDVVDFLKVRYSIGKVGKDDTKAWLWRQRYTFQNGQGGVFGGTTNTAATTGMKMEASPNPNGTWSNELKTDFGIEAKFLNNRLSLGIDSFYNIGTDILMERTGNVPFTVGGTVASENFGKADFFGYEFEAGWNDKIGQDFNYGIDVRFGWSDNKMIQGNFNAADILLPWNARPGQSTDNGVWGYDYLGMFKTQDEVTAYVNDNHIVSVFGTTAANLRPGTLYYRDVRGAYLGNGQFAAPDGIIDVNDQVQLAKRKSPKYGAGTTLKLGYKGFSLNAVVGASFGGGFSEIDSATRKPLKSSINTNTVNRPVIWNNIYDPILNPEGTMPNPAFEAINLTPTSTFWQVNAFRMECRNISLAYAFSEKALNAMHLSTCKLNLIALNPFNLYNPFSYKNPNGAYDVYPTLRTISLGVNVGF
ncbi:SusC/RagA family TonB-linked outer membrane protein [Flavobacterium sp. ZS1P14]|uniref:SusC/RagA family TonB-linked outer membrane protein n=1 Tax=Flavobacterium sp. ZS1P14 TaxID=3401729 RepID=UPI003AAA6446